MAQQAGAQSPAQRAFNLLKWPLLVYAAMASLTIYSWKGNSWFTQHPVTMFIAYVAMAGNAALIKKVGGYENTKSHGVIMTLATLLAIYGFYVIYTQKVMNNSTKLKADPNFVVPHFKSLHGKVGLAVMVGYTGLAVFGAVVLHPDFGIYKRQQTWVRFMHKWAGRAITALSWVCCILGLQSMGKNFYIQAAFSLPLLFFGLYVLV